MPKPLTLFESPTSFDSQIPKLASPAIIFARPHHQILKILITTQSPFQRNGELKEIVQHTFSPVVQMNPYGIKLTILLSSSIVTLVMTNCECCQVFSSDEVETHTDELAAPSAVTLENIT